MRVKGNVSPKSFDIEVCGEDKSKVEVRIRENIKSSEEIVNGFEYDEYFFIINNEPDLKDKIENNLEDWLATGRNLEINPQATLYVKAKTDAIDEYTEELIQGGIL